MDLNEIREHLDQLDIALVTILAKRVSLIPKIAEYKNANNIERFQPDREKDILEKKRDLAKTLNLNPDLVEDVFKRIIEESHVIEKEIMGK